ncbi:MAG: hypothetical protein ACI8RD_014640, partial [Bacillariaceae sp.]
MIDFNAIDLSRQQSTTMEKMFYLYFYIFACNFPECIVCNNSTPSST